MKTSTLCAIAAWSMAVGMADTSEAGTTLTSYTINAHVQDYGQLTYAAGQWVGTRGEGRRLEAFQLLPKAAPNGSWPACLEIEYMAHIRGLGDTGWITAPEQIGSAGQGRQLEGVAFRTSGTCGSSYKVEYRCHLQGTGDSSLKTNGAFCGTRGQGRRLEAFKLTIKQK